ncbi:MAG TPA: diguanylate cyclase, partial [Salinarimonas sp.]|nr:diguanylate cyclase [Salinarimonas sp.]
MSYPLGANEAERLGLLRDLGILDTPPEAQFDAVCRTASRLFGVPIAVVSLIDDDRQWFKARCGLDAAETPREVAFCNHTILQDDVLVVEDATRDERFAGNPLVAGAPGIRFYAGAPLTLRPGLAVGTLCIVDMVPRDFPAEHRAALSDLAATVVAHLRLQEARVQAERREAAAAEREALFALTLGHMDQGLLLVDAGGHVAVCNDRALALLDLPADLMRARPHFTAVKEWQRARGEFSNAPHHLREHARAGGMDTDPPVYRRERRNGTVLEIRTVRLPGGGAVRTFTDVTAQQRAEEALGASEERLQLALRAGRMFAWERDLETDIVTRSDNARNLIGLSSGPASEFVARVHPADRDRAPAVLRGAWGDDTESNELRYVRDDGTTIWLAARSVKIEQPGGRRRLVGVTFDITERKKAEEALRHMANHDALTGLPNRALFQRRLEEALAAAERANGRVALLLLDLDDFKGVNDTIGHDAGDAVLREAARRLRATAGPQDTVARIGGDEFAVIVTEPGDAEAVGQTFSDALRQAFEFGGRALSTRASIGVAL